MLERRHPAPARHHARAGTAGRPPAGKRWKGGAPPPPVYTPPPAPRAEDNAEAEAERRKQVIAAQKSKGRAATILTGQDGDTAAAAVKRKTLLGQ